MNKRKGNNMIVLPIIFVICMVCLFFIIYTIFNTLVPLVYYQKLDMIMTKYMFVIEKFGYLTNLEKLSLTNELNSKGFNIDNIEIKYPKNKKEYGEYIEFNIRYKLYMNNINFGSGKIKLEKKETIINISKNSFSKIDF